MVMVVQEQLTANPASDGDGVKLMRVFSGPRPERFDPFLMLDEFGSDQASDYIGGFPPHPHRGFETVTYMLQGKMEHRDHLDNVGLLEDGGVQWMTAGRGIIHSEMPKQTEGRMRGFQLWVNLPAERKMCPAGYQDIAPESFPLLHRDYGTIKVIAGQATVNDEALQGYFQLPDTQVVMLDVRLMAGADVTITLPEQMNVLVYQFEGSSKIGGTQADKQVLSRLDGKGPLQLHNPTGEENAMLILAGKPLGEPIAQYGPFVMNSSDEIEQAIRDYQAGTLTEA